MATARNQTEPPVNQRLGFETTPYHFTKVCFLPPTMYILSTPHFGQPMLDLLLLLPQLFGICSIHNISYFSQFEIISQFILLLFSVYFLAFCAPWVPLKVLCLLKKYYLLLLSLLLLFVNFFCLFVDHRMEVIPVKDKDWNTNYVIHRYVISM